MTVAVPAVVLDTNIVLDLFVFADEATAGLCAALEGGALRWLATAEMRGELARVLAYPQIAPRLAHRAITAAEVLARFDRHARIADAAAKAPFTCKDPDDQRFVDLAAAHGAWLLSKDKAVLALARRLARVGAQVAARWPAPA